MKQLLFLTLLLAFFTACTSRLDFGKINLAGTRWSAGEKGLSCILAFDENAVNCTLTIIYDDYPSVAEICKLRCTQGTEYINLYFYDGAEIKYIGNFLSKTQLAVSKWENEQKVATLPLFKKEK